MYPAVAEVIRSLQESANTCRTSVATLFFLCAIYLNRVCQNMESRTKPTECPLGLGA
jgi:hypothetical protein